MQTTLTKFYVSIKNNTFYNNNHINLPDDAIEITFEQYNEFYQKVALENKIMMLDKDIGIIFVDKLLHEPTNEELKIQAKQLLKNTDYLMISDTFNDLTEFQQQEIKEYRAALRDLLNEKSKIMPTVLNWIINN